MKSSSIVGLSNHVYNASSAYRGTRCKVQVNVKVEFQAFLNRLSAYITINNTSGAAVVSGTTNSATGKQNGSGMVYTVVTFNDGKGNTFAVVGLIKETISLTAKNANGDQTETGSFSGNVAGYGTVVDSQGNKDTAVFSGTISGSGKGPAAS